MRGGLALSFDDARRGAIVGAAGQGGGRCARLHALPFDGFSEAAAHGGIGTSARSPNRPARDWPSVHPRSDRAEGPRIVLAEQVQRDDHHGAMLSGRDARVENFGEGRLRDVS